MTDNNQLGQNSHAVASDCFINLNPSSVNGRSYRCSIPPKKPHRLHMLQ